MPIRRLLSRRLLCLALAGGLLLSQSACSRGYGCDTSSYKAKQKDGQYSMKKGKSELFPKKMRQKMKQ